MAANKYEICSLALTELGIAPITSFLEDADESRVCGLIWDDYSRYLLSIYPWRFTLTKIQLGRLVAEPLNEYQYQYQLPGDLLRLRAIYDSSGDGATPRIDYQRYENQIYANYEEVYVDYQVYLEPIVWPYWFVEFAVVALAAKLAPILTTQDDIAESKMKRAFGLPSDNLQGGLFGQARRIDSSEQTARPIRSFSLIAVRNI